MLVDDVVAVWVDSEAVGEVVDAWRQREGVKNEDGVDLGVLDRRDGRQESVRRVVLNANGPVAPRALDDKLARIDKPTRACEGVRRQEKTTLALRAGIAAGRSPSCAVAPIMALMTDGQGIVSTPIKAPRESDVQMSWHRLVSPKRPPQL